MTETFRIIPIKSSDNKDLARIIRDSLKEYKANKPGTVYFDKSTDHLSDLFNTPKSAYFVLHEEDKIAGGAGIFPTNGLAADTCELVKMYLTPHSRKKGYAHILLQNCVQKASDYGYTFMYIETLRELKDAIAFYTKSGFTELKSPIGNSGHNGCDIWMIREL